uniref:ribosomal protein L21 n=1 Tax=Streptofilum capillatum TaxID=2058781 RepID=UPI00286C9DAE|nr:ribosomal protein L21 [Streptofilum capillatum]WKT08567.1 ribosomal protein L21 [Streptofilum capillatum]WKT08666.1 ribosomal protein L21 [Streptofilum sp. BC4-VF8pt]WKT08765.1 ribosomal protein L21 [Streptofilum sp. ZNP2-VF4pt]
MTYAIIEAGGRQIRVQPGAFYDIDYMPSVKPETRVLIHRILMISDGLNIKIGQPWVQKAVVKGRLLQDFRGNKQTVYKMIPKKKMRRKQGHRQLLTRLVIDSIYWEQD